MAGNTASGNKDNERYGLMEGMLFSISLFGCAYTAFKPVNPDMFFIISNGKQIYETKELFPSILATSVHPDLSVVIQQPIYSLFVYLIYSRIELIAIPIIGCILACLSLIIIYKVFQGIHEPVVRTLCTCITLLLSSYVFSGRPSGLSLVTMSLSILILERVLSDGSRYLLLLLLPISLLELLCHASFYPLMLFLFLFYLLGLFLASDMKSFITLLCILALSLFISFMTPYKEKLPLYLFNSYKAAAVTVNIKELARPEVLSVYGIIIIGCVLLIMRTYKGVPLFRTFMFISGIMFLAMHVRNLFLLCVFAMPYICFISKRHFTDSTSASTYPFPFVMAAVVFLICICYFSREYPDNAVFDNTVTPILAADYLKEMDAERIFTTFNSGSYLGYRGFKVYIDARPELYCTSFGGCRDILSEYMELYDGYCFDYDMFLSYHGFDYIVVDRKSHFCEYLLYGGYSPVLSGNGYLVFKGDAK